MRLPGCLFSNKEIMEVRYNCTFNCPHGMIKRSYTDQTFQFPRGVPKKKIKTLHTQDFAEHSSCSHFGRKYRRVWEAPLLEMKIFQHLSFYNQNPVNNLLWSVKRKILPSLDSKISPSRLHLSRSFLPDKKGESWANVGAVEGTPPSPRPPRKPISFAPANFRSVCNVAAARRDAGRESPGYRSAEALRPGSPCGTESPRSQPDSGPARPAARPALPGSPGSPFPAGRAGRRYLGCRSGGTWRRPRAPGSGAECSERPRPATPGSGRSSASPGASSACDPGPPRPAQSTASSRAPAACAVFARRGCGPRPPALLPQSLAAALAAASPAPPW